MDIRAFLKEDGLTDEQIDAIVGNDATAKAMSRALGKYDEGTTALTAAQREKSEAAAFWEEKVTPALANVDRKVAESNAEAARYKAYLTTLKSQGYDVPDALVAGGVVDPAKPADPGYVTKADMERMLADTGRNTAPSLIQLQQLSNEYFDLYGKPYLGGVDDFAEAQKQRKSLTDFARDKYAFATKREERAQKELQDKIDAQVAEKYKVREAELVAKFGSNDNLRSPLGSSKFDKVEKVAEAHKDSFKTRAGRDSARADRLKRFEGSTIQ